MRKATSRKDLGRIIIAGAGEWGMSVGLRKAVEGTPICDIPITKIGPTGRGMTFAIRKRDLPHGI